MRRFINLRRLGNHLSLFQIDLCNQVARHRDGDEVHHDGVDDFVRAVSGFQDAGDRRPSGARRHRGADTEGDEGNRGKVEMKPYPSRGKRSDIELPLAADVE